jgi:MFS family permease
MSGESRRRKLERYPAADLWSGHIVLDGIDNQLLGNAVPTLMADWNLPRSAFTSPYGGVLALSPVGMMIGGAIGGMLGDRIGRRNTLLLCVIAFAVFTLSISSVNTVVMLGVLRFLSGLGLGGAMPNAAALASEYVPKRKRPFAVTLTIVCIPLGGMIAGYVSGAVLPNWRALFILGGIIPLILAAVLFQVLPESPRFIPSQGSLARSHSNASAPGHGSQGCYIPGTETENRFRRRHRLAISSGEAWPSIVLGSSAPFSSDCLGTMSPSFCFLRH